MSRRWSNVLLFLGLATVFALAPRAARAERRALLIQIANYREAPMIMLKTVKQNDAPLIAKILQERFQFRTETISETDATQAGMLQALDRLAQEAGPDDAVLFYFSGHGARLKNGRFSICPWDALRSDESNDITEDNLRQWVEKLKTRNVTIILDSCFTNLPLRGRRGAPVTRPKFMGRVLTGLDAPESAPTSIPEDRVTMLMAASENEIAAQTNIGPGKSNGVFTYWLGEELKNADKTTTYRQLMDSVKASVASWQAHPGNREFVQTPTLFGSKAQQDRPLFVPLATKTSPPLTQNTPRHAVVQAVKNGIVTLSGGPSVTVGSQYALYPAKESKFTEKGRLGVIDVTAVSDERVIARPARGTDGSKIRKDCLAVPIKSARNVVTGSEVLLRVDAPEDIAARLRPGLRRLSRNRTADQGIIKLVTTEDAHVILKAKARGGLVVGSLLAFDGETPLEREMEAIEADTPEELVEQVTPMLDRFAVLRTLANLDNPNPAFKITLSTDKPQYIEGDLGRITIRSEKNCYLLLISVDALGVPRLLFPNPSMRDNRIKANTDYSLPPQGTRAFVVREPFGRDTLIALATLDEKKSATLTAQLLDLERPVVAEAPGAPAPHVSGSRAWAVQDNLQQVQFAPLDTWALMVIQVQSIPKQALDVSGEVKAGATAAESR
jgi:hypothetical protein